MAKTLNPKTEPAPNTPQTAKETFSLVPNEKLLSIYAAMVKCSMLEQRATTLFQQGRLEGDLHASSGREATAAAVSIDLQPEDTLSIAPGDWLPAFVKGMSVEEVFRVFAPTDSLSDRLSAELGQKNVLVSPSGTPPVEIAGERAADALVRKKGAIVVVFIAPGTDSLKPWHKLMASAAAKKLPLVFVHYGDQPIETSTERTRSRAANPEALLRGVPAITVDALDAVAVYRVAYEAIIRGRQGRGATLIECSVCPISPHAPGKGEQPNSLRSADPLTTMETYLKRKMIEPGPFNRQIVESFASDLDLATRFLDR